MRLARMAKRVATVLTQADKVVNVDGVKLVGYTNLAAMVGADASA